jgi:hypothetical protein
MWTEKRRHDVFGLLEAEWLEGDVTLSRDSCPVQRREVPVRTAVRAAIVAKKPGNAGGAKGGRKTNPERKHA